MLLLSRQTTLRFTLDHPTRNSLNPTLHIKQHPSTRRHQLQPGPWAILPTSSIGRIRDALPARQGPVHLPLLDSVIERSTLWMVSSVRLSGLEDKCACSNDCLDSSAQIVEAIWPLSSVVCRAELGAKGVLPLRTFIQETLRRSRTSYSTLQVALYYLILIKSHVPQRDFTMEQSEDDHCVRALQCGRRMFLAALILASKYLQDRNYSARAWSKICGLSTAEINQNETAFLLAVNWKLHVTEPVFQKWSDIMLRFTSNKPGGPGAIRSCSDTATWKAIVVQLTPELDNIDTILASPSLQPKPCNPTLCSTPAVGAAPYMLGRYIVEDNDAARALQELSNNPRPNGCSPVNRAGSKRTRPASIDLQGNVRDMLNRKRACCSTEFAAEFRQPTLLARPGLWANILN